MDTRARRAVSCKLAARDRGFTLIELLVVVIIVGILAAIAVPTYLNQRKKAVDASLKADLKNIALVATAIANEGPFPNYQSRPDLGLPDGFNPGGWGTAGAQSTYGLFTFHDAKVTGRLANGTWGDWTGNRVHVGGLPAPGAWQLCAWNPGASKAVDRTVALGYDPSAGGLIAQVDCTQGYWPAITPWFGDAGSRATSWWG